MKTGTAVPKAIKYAMNQKYEHAESLTIAIASEEQVAMLSTCEPVIILLKKARGAPPYPGEYGLGIEFNIGVAIWFANQSVNGLNGPTIVLGSELIPI